MAVDAARDGCRAGDGQPRLPLRPGCLARRSARLRGHVLALHVHCTWTPWPAPAGSTDARLVFEKMLTYANHLGLYSEEIGSSGEQLGNFPQAFTHLALIDSAITLDAALDGVRRRV